MLLSGTATSRLADALRAAGFQAIEGPVGSMAQAVAQATRLSRPGGVVLLSPGAASFGLFLDEFDRGAQFRASARALALAGEVSA